MRQEIQNERIDPPETEMVERPRDNAPEFDDLWRPEEAAESPRSPATWLLEHGKINAEQFNAALAVQRENPRQTALGALVAENAITELVALEALAAYFNLPFQPLTLDQIDRDTLKLLDADFIKRRNVIPIRREENKVLVGISDPADIFLIDEVKRLIRRPVLLAVTPSSDIQRVMDELSGGQGPGVEEIMQDIQDDDVEVVETKSDVVADLEKIAGESPVIRYVNFLVVNAAKEGASDIHIEPSEDRLRIRYRIDGILFEQAAPPLSMHAAVISRLKIMANLDIAERRLPQDGRIRAMVHGRHVDLRMSTLPTTHGEKCVIRILDNRSIMVGLERLGMLEDTLKCFKEAISQPHGIVLVTGPTGSGKTTTLYSAMRVMDGGTLNISTVEDPVEYQLDFANQVNVRDSIGLTFSAALRSLLRQDPDVIMVGEIRDAETARIAVQASLTGHMVLSTLHTNDAPSSITRLINIGIEPFLISASVHAVVAQRLVRKVCVHCKEPQTQIPESIRKYMEKFNVRVDRIYHGVGCDKCRKTGYSGRVGIYEMLLMNDTIRDVMTNSPSLLELRRACREAGMRSLQEDGLVKVADGLTTVEEIARVTES